MKQDRIPTDTAASASLRRKNRRRVYRLTAGTKDEVGPAALKAAVRDGAGRAGKPFDGPQSTGYGASPPSRI